MNYCEECYSANSRATPLLNSKHCLRNHTQYICGTCGRCICIEKNPKRGLRRWNFPFKTLEIAKLYLRTAKYCCQSTCGIYELKNDTDLNSFIFKVFSETILDVVIFIFFNFNHLFFVCITYSILQLL